MRQKNLVRRRYCKNEVIVSELFFKLGKERGAEGLKMGQEKKWETVRTSS